jgi:hypothetical protein
MITIFSTRLIRFLVPWFPGITGLTIFPFIIIRKELRGTTEAAITINHERIHIRQQIELLLLIFVVWYAVSFIVSRLRGMSWQEAYMSIIFEKEAFDRMYDMEYLKNRKPFSFMKYRAGKT